MTTMHTPTARARREARLAAAARCTDPHVLYLPGGTLRNEETLRAHVARVNMDTRARSVTTAAYRWRRRARIALYALAVAVGLAGTALVAPVQPAQAQPRMGATQYQPTAIVRVQGLGARVQIVPCTPSDLSVYSARTGRAFRQLPSMRGYSFVDSYGIPVARWDRYAHVYVLTAHRAVFLAAWCG